MGQKEVIAQTSRPFKEVLVSQECRGRTIAKGAGSLHAVHITQQGCCSFIVRDGEREMFKMNPAFAGSFFLEMGFLENLIIDMAGGMPADVTISYRTINNREN